MTTACEKEERPILDPEVKPTMIKMVCFVTCECRSLTASDDSAAVTLMRPNYY